MKRIPDLEILCFDMEGTILEPVRENLITHDVPPSVWTRLAEKSGPEALETELAGQERWLRGELGYAEWMELLAHTYKRLGLKKRAFDQVMESVPYHPGVAEAFKDFKEMGYVTVLLTGGFKAQADRAIKDLGIDYSIAACEFFWDRNEELSHWNLLPCDAEGKLLFMKAIVQSLGYRLDQCGYVGDSKSDIPCAEAAGMSVAFNAHFGLQRTCTYSVNRKRGEEDFSEVSLCFSADMPF
ncbi:HAD-IB family phosphatase [Candidatus Woesearchaeota archaeon]|nr:HAD-IB family phosphatase [Candidatus Woesearchaeota archaeon]